MANETMRHLSLSSGLQPLRLCGAPLSAPAVHFTLTPDAWLDGAGPFPICPECVAVARDDVATEALRAQLIVNTGVCPDCGTGLVRNTALSGWWQCGAYATESHRQPHFRGLPKCHFQTFTE